MRYTIIESGAVRNIVEAEPEFVTENGLPWVQSDTAAIGDLYDGATFTKPAPDLNAIAVAYDALLDAMFDAKATERRYTNRVTCALRAGYVGPFQAEGVAFAQWMDACNALAYQLLAQAEATGVIPSWEEVVGQMPVLTWPPQA